MSRHRFDPVSFVFGVLFAAMAVLGLVGLDRISAEDLAWAGPVLLLLLGLVALLSAARDPAAADGERPVQDGAGSRSAHGPSRDAETEPGQEGPVGGARDDLRDGAPVGAAEDQGDVDEPDHDAADTEGPRDGVGG